MIKKLSFSFLVTLMVLFSGCSQKEVEVTEEMKTKQAQKSEQKKDDSMQSKVQTEQTNSSAMDPKQEMAKAETKEMKKAPKLNNIYFDYDKFVIRSNMRPVIKNNYKKLQKAQYNSTITLEGHCDERGSDEYNFALGLKRAQTVKSELIEYGVNPSQIKIMSFGENQPLCTKQTQNCWSKNRRVEAVLDK